MYDYIVYINSCLIVLYINGVSMIKIGKYIFIIDISVVQLMDGIEFSKAKYGRIQFLLFFSLQFPEGSKGTRIESISFYKIIARNLQVCASIRYSFQERRFNNWWISWRDTEHYDKRLFAWRLTEHYHWISSRLIDRGHRNLSLALWWYLRKIVFRFFLLSILTYALLLMKFNRIRDTILCSRYW